MIYQAMKRHGRTLNVFYSVKEANLKRLPYCMIQTTWHSRKHKTMGTVKRSVVINILEERNTALKILCSSHDQIAQLVGALSLTPKGWGFNPWSGCVQDVTDWCFILTSLFSMTSPFSLSLSLSLSLALPPSQINKHTLVEFFKNPIFQLLMKTILYYI